MVLVIYFHKKTYKLLYIFVWCFFFLLKTNTHKIQKRVQFFFDFGDLKNIFDASGQKIEKEQNFIWIIFYKIV